jgi:hypothetical protein
MELKRTLKVPIQLQTTGIPVFNYVFYFSQQTINCIDKKARLDARTSSQVPPESEDLDHQEQMDVTRETAYGFMVSERQPLLFEGGALRPYQLDGLDWLKVQYLCEYRLDFLFQRFILKTGI